MVTILGVCTQQGEIAASWHLHHYDPVIEVNDHDSHDHHHAPLLFRALPADHGVRDVREAVDPLERAADEAILLLQLLQR